MLHQVEGITLAVMEKALQQAKAGRQHILQEMQACNPSPAKQLSQYAPRIRRFAIDPEKIGQVIGSGGRTIKMLQAAAGCEEIQVSHAACCCILLQCARCMLLHSSSVCMVPAAAFFNLHGAYSALCLLLHSSSVCMVPAAAFFFNLHAACGCILPQSARCLLLHPSSICTLPAATFFFYL